MMEYFLREKPDGCELSGGRLEEPLLYPKLEASEHAKRIVGFLAQLGGGTLLVYDATGQLIETKIYPENDPLPPDSLGFLLGGNGMQEKKMSDEGLPET